MVGLISRVGGVTVGSFQLVEGELLFVHLFKVIWETSFFVWVLALVRDTSEGICEC